MTIGFACGTVRLVGDGGVRAYSTRFTMTRVAHAHQVSHVDVRLDMPGVGGMRASIDVAEFGHALNALESPSTKVRPPIAVECTGAVAGPITVSVSHLDACLVLVGRAPENASRALSDAMEHGGGASLDHTYVRAVVPQDEFDALVEIARARRMARTPTFARHVHFRPALVKTPPHQPSLAETAQAVDSFCRASYNAPPAPLAGFVVTDEFASAWQRYLYDLGNHHRMQCEMLQCLLYDHLRVPRCLPDMPPRHIRVDVMLEGARRHEQAEAERERRDRERALVTAGRPPRHP